MTFAEQFLAEVRGMPQKNVAIELLRKLLSGEIKIRSRKFLIQSKSFAAMLSTVTPPGRTSLNMIGVSTST